MLNVQLYCACAIIHRKPSLPRFINRSSPEDSTHLHSSLLWVKAVSGWDVWSAGGAISIAQELKDFYCVACVLFLLSALLSPAIVSLCFMRFLFMLWFTFERNWFSLMFSYTSLLPPPSTRRLSFMHTNPKKFVWGQHNTKHFSFSFFFLPGIINIASNISSPARSGMGRRGVELVTHLQENAFTLQIRSFYLELGVTDGAGVTGSDEKSLKVKNYGNS